MKTNLLKSIFISLILLVGATNAWAATIFNCGIEVNETWYKGTGTINSGNWLADKTAFNNKDFGVITSLKLGGQYDTWDNNQKDQCSWNGNNGLKITISTESGTQKAEFRLSCYNSGFASNNNTWKTTGTINNCGDKSAFGRYTYDISSYAAGKYKMKATWFSPSGISTDATANFTIPGFTTTSKSQKFDSTPIGKNSSKTISFSAHYGTALKTGDCSLSGTNSSEFSVTSITESNVTVQFKPTSTGEKSATLTIKDAHNKTCTITLTGEATPPTYTVTFNANGHGTAPAAQTVSQGSKAIQPTAPTATGYTFGGWYKEANCTNAFDFNTAITADITLYAKWTANTYTVNLDREPSTDGTASVTAIFGSDMPAITKPTRTGYTFGGYYTEKNGGGTQYYNANGGSSKAWNIAANTTLYAKWTAIKYNITYTNLGGATHTNATKYTIEDAITFSEPSARNGYTFAGWYPASIEKGSTGDKTITAQWTEKPGTTVYLKANDMWKSDGAKLAVYAWNNTENTWLDVEYDDCTGNLLMAEIPAKYNTGIKFVRLNPNPTSDDTRQNNGYNFANAWNQTNDLKIPADNNNLYDLTKKYIYLKPNDNWKEASARFAAYFYKSSGSENKWKDMTDADDDGYYSCEKPDGYDWVIFCRMNPATSANNWNNRWNQSANQGIPEKNLFTVNDGQWGGKGEDNDKDGATGHWDNNHWDNSQWTTYTAPTFDVTISAATNGTIKVAYNSQTYTSGQTISNVPIHTELNVTFTPADGYILTTPLVTYADVVADNIYSICGPTVISAEFVPQGTTKTIYLRPNDDWLKDDAIFIAHAWKDGSSDLHDYLMTTKDDDYTGSYSCTIDSKYDRVLFARINPEYKTNQELSGKWMWNKTKDLQITDDVLNENGYRFAIKNKNGDLYDGEWEENTPIWGLTADFNLWHAEDAIFRGYTGKVDILLHSKTHQFLLYNIKTEEYCPNNGTYTRGNSGQWWTMNEQNNCQLVADVDKAIYHFQMQYVTQVGEFKKQISITYPNSDVYYLAYQEGENSKSFRKSHALNKITEGEKEDLVSFFVDIEQSPYIYLLDAENNILSKHPIAKTGGEHPNNAMLPGKRNSPTLSIGSGCGVTNSGVYNFVLHQEGNTAQIDAAATHLYTGSYYIRTDASEGGWNDFRQQSNKITYSSFADSHSNFNHYYCKYIEAGSNVKFTIANDYSYCISDTLDNDAIIQPNQSSEGCLPPNKEGSANVRFGWDSNTNEISRAYIKGAGMTSDRFLVLQGKDNNLKDANGKDIPVGTGDRTGLLANEEILVDQQNWIYQVDVTANNATQVKLIAEYNGTTQYFKGNETEYTGLLSSTASDTYKIRLIYDFKSNHLVIAWLAGGTVEDEKTLGADMMVIRKDQQPAAQLNFDPTASPLKEVGIGYAVMTFTKDHILDNDLSERERSLYWVSFPFDVKISDVFGFGEYAEHWILQYYDGAERAEKGLFSDSGTYWKYIFDTDTKLKAGEGYVLVLDLSKVEFLHGAQEVSLYFPSTGKLTTITGDLPTKDTVPAHWCNIDREWTENEGTQNEVTYHHKYTDSHWNLIGVPGFADIKGFDVTAYHFTQYTPDVSFYYAFDLKNSTYTVADAATNFQAMYSYMVQFAGTINWVSKTVSEFTPQPASIAARRYSDDQPEKVVLRLELAQGEEVADRTFVQLQQEGATANFDLSLDLTKIVNIGVSNIYTLTDSLKIQTAGNVLPFEETTVAVGVDIATAGEYTFRMPDGTEGMVVELIDYETNTTTNLLLDDYTVNLPTGSNETRFALSLKPEKTATSIESTTSPSDSNIHKFIIDGKLYLQKDGMLYDAQGKLVR